MLRCVVCDGLFETFKAWRKHKAEVIKHQRLIKQALKFDCISYRTGEDSFLDLNRPNYPPLGDKKLYSRGEYGIPVLEGSIARKKGGAKKR